MTFRNKFEQKQSMIEAELTSIFIGLIKDAPEIIREAMQYSLMAGGKRIRPMLAETVCTALGGLREDVMAMGCAIEMIHTYSLIHDDLPAMDNDELRRGKPTNHIVFGEAMAILAGDGLLNCAFETIFSKCISSGFDMRFVKAGELIAKASGVSGMIGGQVIDMQNEDREIQLEQLYKMHEKKTGALISAACLTGCLISGKTNAYDTVKEYSQNLGIAFQIVDDILDCIGDAQKLGKKTGSDVYNNKSTFVSVLGLEESKKLASYYSLEAKRLAGEIDCDGFLSELTDFLLHREY